MHAGVSTVGYFTDVEGHSDYFDKCVASSGVLTLVSDSSGDEQLDVSGGDLCVLGCNCGSHAVVVLTQLRPGAAFVFGGDAFDKGTGDLHVIDIESEMQWAWKMGCGVGEERVVTTLEMMCL